MKNQNSDNSIKLFLTLIRDTLHYTFNSVLTPLQHRSKNSHCALWLQSGRVDINQQPLATGQGIDFAVNDTIANTNAEPAVILRFIVSTEPLSTVKDTVVGTTQCELILTQLINTTSTELLLRLDQVDFPPAAIAYEHTHPGPGIRYLVKGGLKLTSDHGNQKIETGDAWFEGTNSPVTAIAINTVSSRFVRTMLLPPEYEGRSTFTLRNRSDADKPRLQSNIRHFEKRIRLGNIH